MIFFPLLLSLSPIRINNRSKQSSNCSLLRDIMCLNKWMLAVSTWICHMATKAERIGAVCFVPGRGGPAGWVGQGAGAAAHLPAPPALRGCGTGPSLPPSLLRAANPTAPLGQCPWNGVICFRAPCLNCPRGESFPPGPGWAHLVAPPAEVFGSSEQGSFIAKSPIISCGLGQWRSQRHLLS